MCINEKRDVVMADMKYNVALGHEGHIITPGPIDSTSREMYPTRELINAYPNPETNANTDRLKGDFGFADTVFKPASALLSNR